MILTQFCGFGALGDGVRETRVVSNALVPQVGINEVPAAVMKRDSIGIFRDACVSAAVA